MSAGRTVRRIRATRPGNGGCAVIGQLIADVTGSPYAGAVTRLVRAPRGDGRLVASSPPG